MVAQLKSTSESDLISGIFFHLEDIKYKISNKKNIVETIKHLITAESKTLGTINIILCSDEYLLQLNQQSLNHDFYTDIITFNYNQNNVLNGDLYISVDRIKDNALKLNVEPFEEFKRVVIHGLLHLCGYNDKIKIDKNFMTMKEDYYLNVSRGTFKNVSRETKSNV